MTTLVTLAELADAVSKLRGEPVSENQIFRHEEKWGLTAARRDLNSRVIRYDLTVAIELLKAATKGVPRAGTSASTSSKAASPAARLVAQLKAAAAKRSEAQIVDACREMAVFAEDDGAEIELNEAGAIEVLGSWPCIVYVLVLP